MFRIIGLSEETNMFGEGKSQPRREGDHFVSFRDEQLQAAMDRRDVENIILERVTDGAITVEFAQELTGHLHLPNADSIGVLGMLLTRTGITDGS
jgi:hypothetical protein